MTSSDRWGHLGPARFSIARSAGISRGEVASGEFSRVRRGLYVASEVDMREPLSRIAVAQEISRGRFPLGGWAAAHIWEEEVLGGLPAEQRLCVFDGRTPWPEGKGELEPVLLCMRSDERIVPSLGVRPWRSDFDATDVEHRGALSLTSPLRTAFDLARTRSLWGGVIAVDRLAGLGLLTVEDFAQYVGKQRGRKWVRKAHAVAALADGRAESPPESVARLVWLEAGLPTPEANVEIRDEQGRFVARVDLLDPRSRLVLEYDGAHHADARRRSRDSGRELILEALGFTVVKVTSVDLASAESRRGLSRRLRRAHLHALTRSHAPAR